MKLINLNFIAMIAAVITTAVPLVLAFRSRLLRVGLLLLAAGIFFSMMVHAIAEYLESIGIIPFDVLITIMPILITMGSVLIMIAGAHILRNVTWPLKIVAEQISQFSSIESSFNLAPGLKGLNNEIGDLVRRFEKMIGELKNSTISRDYIQSIMASMLDPLVVFDAQGKVEIANAAAVKLSEYGNEELIGRDINTLFVKTIYGKEKGSAQWINKNPTGGYRTKVITKSGKEVTVNITWSALYHDTGREKSASAEDPSILGFVLVAHDMTTRTRMEEELRMMNMELRGREKELSTLLTDLQKAHDELKQAQAQVFHAEKLASIGQLAAGVAHEINNPVGFISNNMEILERYVTDYGKIVQMADQLKKIVETGDLTGAKTIVGNLNKLEEEICLGYITTDAPNLLRQNKEGIDRIQKIIADLRTFARDDRNVTERIKIEDVIESVLNIVHNEIIYKAELKKNYGDTPAIPCNSQQLGQVFINLLMNAVQAIKEKGVVEIKTYREDVYVCVEIRDTGMGILEEHIHKIFEPFFTTKPVGQGTGLGLSISHEIVKKHGGKINVQSKPGAGTTFTVILPVS